MKTNLAPQLSRAAFRSICDSFAIPAKDRAALAGLVYHGKPVGARLFPKIDGRWRGSRRNGQYAKCMVAILQALSAHCEHKFPPKDYRVPKGYKFYS